MISEDIRKIVLPNGVRVVVEKIPYVRSVSLGLWIDVGSRNETANENGIGHFIEHMLFKGTSSLNALQVSQEINKIGGNVNAFTTQEHICLSCKVIDEHFQKAFNLLFEMYSESIFDSLELDRERNVILEEVKMYDDLPDELVIDEFIQGIYPDNSLGNPIIGQVTNINSFSSDMMKDYVSREFTPDRLVVSIVGNIDFDVLENSIIPCLATLQEKAAKGTQTILIKPPEKHCSKIIDRNLKQIHFCLGGYGPDRRSEDRFSFYVLNTILGSGASSRIFQEVREKRGLVYSIGTFDIAFKDTGCIAISGGCTPRNLPKVLDLSLNEVKKTYLEKVTLEELESAKEQLKTGILLGMESSGSRMSRMAEYELYFGEYIPVEEALQSILKVTQENVMCVAEKYFKDKPVAFSGIGKEKYLAKYQDGLVF